MEINLNNDVDINHDVIKTKVAEAEQKILQFINDNKTFVSDSLKENGFSRLSRLVKSLPCSEAPSIQLLAEQSLPKSRDALALAAASSTLLHVSDKKYTKAIECADITLILIGVHESFLQLIEIIEENVPQIPKQDGMDGTLNFMNLKRIDSLNIPEQLMTDTCNERNVENISTIEFDKNYFQKDIPLTIRKLASEWKAITKWKDMKQMINSYGNRIVPVEYNGEGGSSEMKEKFEKIEEIYKSMYNNDKQIYLAQHPILDYIPKLKNDIQIPFDLINDKQVNIINIWMGTIATGSKLHYDTYDNILIQILGIKTVVLISPDFTPFLYSNQSNLSSIDLSMPLNEIHKQFPLFSNVKSMKKITLYPGDALFIPSGYWHWVRSETSSISINYWFS